MLNYIIATGVTELDSLQFYHVGARFSGHDRRHRGGMALSKLNSAKPILIMCTVPEDENLTKVSIADNGTGRGGGIDLQKAISEASARNTAGAAATGSPRERTSESRRRGVCGTWSTGYSGNSQVRGTGNR
jgi:RecJ-like exonuclease